MIIYTTGDLLKSDATALVNTVNCEGYMGKGIAYQFKLVFPENNKDYIRACKSGELTVGKLHYFNEKDKLIINFPTKNKWRAKSRIEYIVDGLDELVKLINYKAIKTIALPPLGSGNGGLDWSEVKSVIEEKLSCFPDDIKIIIYEPSKNFASKATQEPQLSLSSLILMEIKLNLDKFDKTRLQKTAYFLNVYSGLHYFKFKKHRFGPYDNSLSILSKKIKEFQSYHNVNNTYEAYKILFNRLVSENVEKKLNDLKPALLMATEYVNTIETNHELECLSTITFLIDKQKILTQSEILALFKSWSTDKAERFTDEEIINGIHRLCDAQILEESLIGYSINKFNQKHS
ncbi:type II toxin-antitoxin system antitoxin DNA ADP-ribosyl glycohydrolase DarG [Priestia megaterium]|uniref:type II toxin-antitoxin system antitoxin DNA ADP-ribosyl glycohydrolase DarG n=1 Tax=Priestia megaterium TaxID=1404 RepID=UPI002877A779|nr:macro domain-containing protein [Priestia megaterium]MBX4164571.1 macro domain-containing protein [Priestia megaterium]